MDTGTVSETERHRGRDRDHRSMHHNTGLNVMTSPPQADVISFTI